jgi:hypothetical protein
MKDIKGLIMFFGFVVALCLVVFGYGEMRAASRHVSEVTEWCALLAGVALFYVLYRIGNSN